MVIFFKCTKKEERALPESDKWGVVSPIRRLSAADLEQVANLPGGIDSSDHNRYESNIIRYGKMDRSDKREIGKMAGGFYNNAS